MQIHEKIQPLCSESTAAVLLAFHAEDLSHPSVGGKLPLTLYETNYEQDEKKMAGDDDDDDNDDDDKEDKEMADAPTSSAAAPVSHIAVKLREMTYTVETHESEMISIDFVARGAANASAEKAAAGTEGAASGADSTASSSNKNNDNNSSSNNSRDRAVAVESGNGKRRLVAATEAPALTPSSSMTEGPTAAAELDTPTEAAAATPVEGILSAEEEELIATLTTRANAIRMLHARLQLLTKYLASLPEDALANGGGKAAAAAAAAAAAMNNAIDDTPEPATAAVGVSLPILRSIQALVQRLPLAVPPPVAGAFEEEQRRQANDVHLVSLLLDDMMQSISSTFQVGDKFGVVENARASARRQGRMGGAAGEYFGRSAGGGSSSFDALL